MSSPVYVLNISKDPVLHASAKLMTEVMTVSRLNYKPDLMKMKNVCPLPKALSTFNKSFEEICIARAQDIWAEHSKNNIMNVFWSGGIDSTTALVALLKTRPNGCGIQVHCNLNSIIENDFFYKLLLKEQFVNLTNSSLVQIPEKVDIITGELGDQIFGSDLLYGITNLLGFEKLFEDYSEIIPKLFVARAGAIQGHFLYDRYRPIIDECPFKIKSAFDFIWWWNYTQKWQCLKYRSYSLLDPKLSPVHFFENDDFQQWGLFNHDKKISSHNLETYKMPAKEFIFSYDKNNSYRKNKRKLGSSFANKIYFYALMDDGTKAYTWSECNNLIEQNKDQFQVQSKIGMP